MLEAIRKYLRPIPSYISYFCLSQSDALQIFFIASNDDALYTVSDHISWGGRQPTEAESLMASALLKIRSESTPRNERPSGKSQNEVPVSGRSTSQEPTSSTHCRTASFPPPLAPTPNQLYGNSRFAILQAQSSQQQLAALQAAAAVGAASIASNHALRFNLLRSGLLTSQHHPAETQTRSLPTDSLTDSRSDNLSSTSQELSMRQEKVEAALKSKPQRGRKRENLSELERLELTRTRNREHAKSTRVRKKARYEELLDNEKCFYALQAKEELARRRRQCIIDFSALRASMARDSLVPALPAQSADVHVQHLATLVEDVTTFSFFAKGYSVGGQHNHADGQMREFDRELTSRVAARFGEAVLPLLVYDVSGSGDGIALSASNSGLAMIEISLSAESKIPLMSGLLNFEFMNDSSKVRSVYWTVLKDCIDKECLSAQSSYPSVVSLEQGLLLNDSDKIRPSDKQQPRKDGDKEEFVDNPGMSI
jgi:hypothetical protein